MEYIYIYMYVYVCVCLCEHVYTNLICISLQVNARGTPVAACKEDAEVCLAIFTD